METNAFWSHLDTLVAGHPIVIDRPRGSAHPRYPDFIYPLDYGYLSGTSTADGGGIDVWLGSLDGEERRVTAAICTVDLVKQDTEVKLLINCTSDEAALAYATLNTGPMAAILLHRSANDSPA